MKSNVEKVIDSNKIDALLEQLYKSDGMNPFYMASQYNILYRDEPNFDENFSYVPYSRELKGLGLAELLLGGGTRMQITPFGRKVYSEGGWIAYSKKEKDKEERDLRLRELEVTATVSAAESSKKSNRAAWIASIVAALAFLLSGKQYLDGQSDKTEYLKQMESLQKSIKAYEQELGALKKSMADSKLKALSVKAK